MDERRKSLIVTGVQIGDITLALAGLAAEIPPWAAGLDLARYASEAGAEGAAREVEGLLSGADAVTPEAKGADAKALATTLAPGLAGLTVDRAIARGKFLSATRCLEILNKKDEYVARYLAAAQKHIGQGELKQAAEALVTASNLELNEGTPLFQYTGPALHQACTASREKCVTALPADAAVLVALQYLLEGARTCEAVGALSAEARKELLPFVAQARDPEAANFCRAYKQAQSDLEAIEQGDLAALKADLKRLSGGITAFADAIGSASSGDVASRDVLERVMRNAASLRKEFSDIENLVGALQLRRIRRRLEQVVESRAELTDARDALKKGSGLAASMDSLLDVVDDLTNK
ncbi:MAG: hypothetical protein WAW06_00950, partial [bacterium]